MRQMIYLLDLFECTEGEIATRYEGKKYQMEPSQEVKDEGPTRSIDKSADEKGSEGLCQDYGERVDSAAVDTCYRSKEDTRWSRGSRNEYETSSTSVRNMVDNVVHGKDESDDDDGVIAFKEYRLCRKTLANHFFVNKPPPGTGHIPFYPDSTSTILRIDDYSSTCWSALATAYRLRVWA
ncbi:hypothetical protein PM082_007555 [Marasmius tenuissimus]|nr:hypothetical protein PM082_007555 [Marasmius tenuissimus]